MKKQTKIAAAVSELVKALKKDKEYRETWKANIAMAYIDNWHWYSDNNKKTVMNAKDRHAIANNAADYFLQSLCDEIKYPEGR